MVVFNVRTTALDDASRLMLGVLATFDTRLSEAQSVVNSVAAASWQGQDADEFLLQWQQFTSSAEAVRAHLSTIAIALQTAAGTYAGGEDSNVTSFVSNTTGGTASVVASTGQVSSGTSTQERPA